MSFVVLLFVLLFLRRLLCRLAVVCRPVMHWLNMSVGIFSEAIIANGVLPPIRMVSFPSMKTLQPDWITDQPDTASSQIEILVTNQTDVFAIKLDVTVRNHDWLLDHRLRGNIHRRRSHNDRLETYRPIWLNDTA